MRLTIGIILEEWNLIPIDETTAEANRSSAVGSSMIKRRTIVRVFFGAITAAVTASIPGESAFAYRAEPTYASRYFGVAVVYRRIGPS